LEVVIRLVAPASGEAKLTRDIVVQLNVDLVEVINSRPVGVVVIDHRRTPNVGLRDIGNDLQGNGIQPVRGNLVAWERRLAAAIGIPGNGIVYGGTRAAHIAAELRAIGERQNRRIGRVVEIDFVTAEVEELVPDNVAAGKAA